jgi:glycosyltransferase 2 family protein
VSRGWWGRARLVAGLLVLGVLVREVGTGPFLDGLRTVDAGTLLAGAALAVPTTICCAQRWRLVARGLGVSIGLPAAVAACYRSQFLNTVLPGGVLGDVHRGVRQGRESGDTVRGVRAVAWERLAGQMVQVATTLTVLLLVPSPVRSALPTVAVTFGVVALVGVLVLRVDPRSRGATLVGALRRDLRDGPLSPEAWPGVAATSFLAVAGHVATFLVAARAAGVTTPSVRLVPLALLVLLAMAVPLNVAGWGPREGVAAWAFAAAGLGAGPGVTTAVVYGVLALVAGLPGAVVLLATWLGPRAPAQPAEPLVTAGQEGAGG